MTKLLTLIFIVFATPLWAQSALELDSSQPIEIAADELEVLQDKNMAIFRGDVEAIQGNITLKAEKMEVFYRQAGQQSPTGGFGAVSRIEVENNVMLATPQESAKASRGIYNVDKQVITLVGNVVLTRDKNMLRGGQMVYNLKTQKSLLTSGKAVASPDGTVKSTGGRVKGVFIPKQ